MKRLRTLAVVVASTGLLCGAGVVGASGIATAGTGAKASATSSVPRPGGPIIRARASGNSSSATISLNWSGYAALASKPFTYAHTRFVQPAVTCDGKANRWTSNWVGLDGFNTNTVEQDGTFATCGGKNNMTPQYVAWYEMFPAGSVSVFNVKAGDVMDAVVRFSNGKFHLKISDLTSGKSASKAASCAQCKRASAESIIERPALCNNSLTKCFITALANFGTATMAKNWAQVSGGKVQGIGAFSNIPIFMVNPLNSGGFISLDTVGALDMARFTATWDRSGGTVPITLGPKR
jgi:peptidase A4-like protein